MLSPAQRHKQKIEMQQKLEQRQAIAIADGESMHLQARAIERDVKRLRALNQTFERVAMKRDELLPMYQPTAQRYLDEGVVYKNPIFVYCVIWLFDVGEFDKGLDWADIAIEPYFSRTFKNVTEKWRVHEKIQAKWFKFHALELLKGDVGDARASAIDCVDTLNQADAYLARAHQLNPKSGVKTHRLRIASRLRALEQE